MFFDPSATRVEAIPRPRPDNGPTKRRLVGAAFILSRESSDRSLSFSTRRLLTGQGSNSHALNRRSLRVMLSLAQTRSASFAPARGSLRWRVGDLDFEARGDSRSCKYGHDAQSRPAGRAVAAPRRFEGHLHLGRPAGGGRAGLGQQKSDKWLDPPESSRSNESDLSYHADVGDRSQLASSSKPTTRGWPRSPALEMALMLAPAWRPGARSPSRPLSFRQQIHEGSKNAPGCGLPPSGKKKVLFRP